MEHATQKKNALAKEVLMMEVAHLDMGFVVYVSTKNNLLGILNLKIYLYFFFFKVSLGCGATISENNSYFVSSGSSSSGDCRLKVCQCNDDICQVCMWFFSFPLFFPKNYFCKKWFSILIFFLSKCFF